MAPSDRPGNSTPIQGGSESRSDHHMQLYPFQLFIRYEHRRRQPNSRTPNQGRVNRLPGVATLLRRHSAMQATGLTRDPTIKFDEHRLSGNFECWTPPRLTGSPVAIGSPDSKRMPLTANLETTRDHPYNWSSSNPRSFEPKIVHQVLGNQVNNSKSPSPTRSPEPVCGSTQSRPKSSRYLREIDRRRILMRIAQGEKQSALAKEYHVSRAAICNLNKHRAEVLSRNHEHPLAKHPKRRMLTKPKMNDMTVSQAHLSDSSSSQ